MLLLELNATASRGLYPVAREYTVVLKTVFVQQEVIDAHNQDSILIVMRCRSVLGDLVAMFAIGFDAFIPITIGATVLFVIGLLMTMFSH